MTGAAKYHAVDKIATGISSFDIIAKGGLPRNRTTLISGTAGSGKTSFAVQLHAAGIEPDQVSAIAPPPRDRRPL